MTGLTEPGKFGIIGFSRPRAFTRREKARKSAEASCPTKPRAPDQVDFSRTSSLITLLHSSTSRDVGCEPSRSMEHQRNSSRSRNSRSANAELRRISSSSRSKRSAAALSPLSFRFGSANDDSQMFERVSMLRYPVGGGGTHAVVRISRRRLEVSRRKC